MNSDTVPKVNPQDPLKYEQADVAENQVPLENFNGKLFFIGTFLFIFIISTSGLIFFLWFQIKGTEQKADISAEITKQETIQESSASASLASKDSLNRQEITFEVLNGSGIAGSAKKAAEKLEALGYKVINTGNADKNGYSESEVLISSGLESKKNLILEDLKTVFKIASTSGELSDSTASARLIVGKES